MVETPFTTPVCLPGRHRQRIVAIVFGVMILVFGIIIGSGGTFLYFRDRLTPTTPPPPNRIAEMVREMKDKLDLSEKQEKQIHTLFEERFKSMGEFFKSIGEKQKQEWELTVNGMKSILTEEQFSTWKKDMDERRQKWGRDSRGQGGPGRGGPEGRGGPGSPDRGDNRRGGGRPGQDDRPQQSPQPGSPISNGPPSGGNKPMEPPAPAGSATETPKPASPDTPVQQPPAEPKPQ